MGKTAFIFPGQGAQHIGMGKDFYDEYKESRQCFEQSSEILGFDIAEICFKDEEKLNKTEYTQAAMLTVFAAIMAAVRETDYKADVTAGLSLGEYGALLASEAISYEAAIRLVRKRGLIMQEAYPVGGAMSAVLGLDIEGIEEVLRVTKGVVSIANYNCPGQIIISGEKEAVVEAGKGMLKKGAKKVIELNVSGPFHSKLLEGAGSALSIELGNIDMNEPKIPYVSNVTAEYVTSRAGIKELLAKQVYSPVLWQQSIETMINNGVDTFIEIGPLKTLTGFIRRISKNVKLCNINSIKDLKNTVL